MNKQSFEHPRAAVLKSLAVAIGVIGAGAAHAAAFQLMEGNASGLGNAYAGSAAVAENASTVFYNPAGMSLLPGRNVAFSVDAVRPSAEFSNRGSTLSPLGGNGGDAGEWAAVPAGYFTMQITDALTFGLGVGAPFGLKTEYSPSWVGRFHAVKSEIKTININPSLSFKVNDKLAIGGGISYQNIDADLTNLVTNPGLAGSLAKGRVKGDDTAWGWNVGLLYQLTPTMRIGLAYRSTMDYKLEGTARFNGLNATGNVVAAALNTGRGGKVTADVELPDSATLSVVEKISDRWTMLGDISWTGWSTLQSLKVTNVNGTVVSNEELRWRDTWRVAFGGIYAYDDAINLKFGLAWDQTPVRDSTRLPRVPDENRIWLSLGVQWKPSKTSAVDIGYAHLFAKDAKVNNDGGNAPLKGTLVGEYDNSVDIIGIQYSARF